jgi:integrase
VRPTKVYSPEELQKMINNTAAGSLERSFVRAPKSKRSRRTLDLSQKLPMSLSLEAQMSAEREQPGFRNRRGQTAASKAASQILDAAITAEVKRLTLHKLRHTIASMLLARPVLAQK